MKTWKPLVVLLILAGFAGCSGEVAPVAEEVPAPAADASTPPAEPPAPAGVSPTPSAPAVAPKPAAVAPAPKPIVIPAGTELSVILADALDSGKNKAGDEFAAHLAAPIMAGGRTVIDTGAQVQGRVIEVESSGRVSGKATMRLVLTGVTHRGKVVPLVTQALFEEAKGTKGRDAAVIAGAAGVGAAIGAIAGGGKGAATGAAIGGGAGAGTVLATKGEQVKFPAETKLAFTLEKELQVNP